MAASQGFHLRKIVSESLFVSFTDYIYLGVLFGITVLVNRAYGTYQLGVFSLVAAVSQISIMSLGSGFSAILRRDVSTESHRAREYVVHILCLRAGILLSCLAVVCSASLATRREPALTYALALMIASKGFDLGSETFYTTYQSLHSMRLFATIKSTNFLTLGSFAFFCCMQHWSIQHLYEVHLAVSIFFFGINAAVYSLREKVPAEESHANNARSFALYLLRETWPLILNAAIFQLSSRMNIIVVNAVCGPEQQGLYASGVNIILATSALSNSLGIVIFPYLARLYRSDSRLMLARLNGTLAALFAVGLLVASVMFGAAPLVIRIYGRLPMSATSIFRILSLAIVPLFMLGTLGYVFTIVGKQRLGMYLAAVMLVVNLISYYALASYWAATGAAVAFVLVQCAAVLLFYVSIVRSLTVTEP